MNNVDWLKETREIVKNINVDLNNVNDTFKFIFLNDSLNSIRISGNYYDYDISRHNIFIIDKLNNNIFSRVSYSDHTPSLFNLVINFIIPLIIDKNKLEKNNFKDKLDIAEAIKNDILSYNNKYNITHMEIKFIHYKNFLKHLIDNNVFIKNNNKVNSIDYPDLFNVKKNNFLEVESKLKVKNLLESLEFLTLNYDTNPEALKSFLQKHCHSKHNKFKVKK